MDNNDHMPITVIILTKNRLAKLRQVVAALERQLDADDQILIVDTGSVDGTRDWLAKQSHPLRWEFTDSQTLDFGAARNLAIGLVATPTFAFLDDDCIPAVDWLKRAKQMLQKYDAVGGIVLPYWLYELPRLWSGEIAWCAGMSPVGLLERREDNYPATANLAAWRHVAEKVSFGELCHAPLVSEQRYLAGREDAEWWLNVRRHGFSTAVDARLAVFHAVPYSRFSLTAVLKRAHCDGVAAWHREPHITAALAEREHFLTRFARELASPLTLVRRGPSEIFARLVWATREFAYLSAANKSSVYTTAAKNLPRLATKALREIAGTTRLRIKVALRPKLRVPDPPHHLLIAAPTYLGDTVLLLPIIDILSRNWPETNIVVWTRFPELIKPRSPMISVFGNTPPEIELVREFALWSSEITFTPYYHFGPQKLWRKVLSLRGATFSHDVGFPTVADYYHAPLRVPKRFDQHEVINLLELVSLWPLAGSLTPPRISPTEEAMSALHNRFPVLDERDYVTFHIDTALEMKRWPLDRWQYVAQAFVSETRARVCFIGTEKAREQAEILSRNLGGNHALNCCGLGLEELVALLAGAQMAVGPCSGPKHLAYALRTPTFTLYGAVPEHRWGAWFDRELHDYVSSPVEYLSAREQRGLPENHAMLLLPADEIARRVVEHYQRLRTRCA
ncbi:MAG: glycosyltransferase [Candidatus Sumerlaeaceae bacterium]|nr:glycosyltransferase [Candidatus Sumerlaeaceae bacterium]